MEPSTVQPYRMVHVRGKDYLWTPESGLDPAVVETVDPWIWRGAYRLRVAAQIVGLSVEDIVQEGRLGALRSAQDFDPRRNAKFLTYAFYWIRHRMLEALGTGDVSISRRKREALLKTSEMPRLFSLDRPLPGWDQDLGTTLPADPEPDMDPILGSTKARIRAAIMALGDKDRELIIRRYWCGETLDQIGQSWGRTRQRVAQIETRALQRLRHSLGEVRL